jgi:hypothetical protein
MKNPTRPQSYGLKNSVKEEANRILLLMPYFGRWPEWFFIFLETCKHNPSVEWLFLTDCGEVRPAPSNVRFVRMPFAEMRSLSSQKLGRSVKLPMPFKICDLRLCYAKIFDEFIAGYDFWGFGDIDVVYGNLSGVLKGEALSHDIISFHKDHLSGHLCLFRNNEIINTLYTRIKNFEDALGSNDYLVFDELLLAGGTAYSSQQKYIDDESLKSLSICAFEAFSTPFSLYKPWIDGTFRFPAEWTWENGQLTSDIDAGRGFPYLHFKYWKEGGGAIVAHGKRHWRELRRLVYIDPREVKNGFRINCYGFHPLSTDKPCPDFIDAQWKLFLRRTKNMVRFHLDRARVMRPSDQPPLSGPGGMLV